MLYLYLQTVIVHSLINRNNIETSMLRATLIVTFLTCMFLTSIHCQVIEAVNWPVNISRIKSGEHKLLLTVTTNVAVLSYEQPFNITFLNIPGVALGNIGLQIYPRSSIVNYTSVINASSITKTKFSTNLYINTNITIAFIVNMYLGIDQSALSSTIYYYQQILSQLAGAVNSTERFAVSANNLNVNEGLSVHAFFSGMIIDISNGEYSMNITATIANSSAFQVQVSSNSTLTRLDFFIITLNTTAIQANHLIFVDQGTFISLQTGASFQNHFNPVTFNYYNAIFGYNSFRIINRNISFFATASNTINSSFSFEFVTGTAIQWRFRQCHMPTYFYLDSFKKCYSSCPSGYANNSTYLICQACSYSCNTCSGDGVTCLDCPDHNTTFRSQNASTCPCDAGYFDYGFAACGQCSYTCKTCVSTSTNCLLCDSSRNSSTSACSCNNRLFDTNTNNSICSSCSYSCLSCQNISTNCTSCNSSAQRILDAVSAKCLCQSQFEQNTTSNVEQCASVPALVCLIPCVTCVSIGTNCTSCNTTNLRVLTNQKCICKQYYSESSGSLCQQICGDGVLVVLECDDGNTVSGDGCSNSCTIEANYTCNKASPTVCLFNAGYSVSFSSLTKIPDSNNLQVIFIINPAPPSNTVPNLDSLQSSLQITSYSLSGQIMTINMMVSSSLSASDFARVSFSGISKTAQAPILSSNDLIITPYTDAMFTLHKAQTALVWGYIALIWLASIILLIFVELKLLGPVIQLFFYSGLAWIGVMGIQNLGLLYSPLKNLQYLFAYNFTIDDNSGSLCLFYVLNLGFVLNVIPLIIFGCLIVFIKCKNIDIDQKIKRVILFDFSYAWLAINSFMVVYGLSLAVQNGLNNAISITSLIAGIVYLILLMVISVLLFKDSSKDEAHPKMQTTSANMFRPFFLPIYYITVLLCCLAYLCLKSLTNFNSLGMVVILLIFLLTTIFANLYINKIRYLLNLFSLILIYGCIFLFQMIPTAEWTGTVILGLMYIQLISNVVFMYLEAKKGKVIESQYQLETSKYTEPNQIVQLNNSGFTIYQPKTAKKHQKYDRDDFATNFKKFDPLEPESNQKADSSVKQKLLIENKYNMNKVLDQIEVDGDAQIGQIGQKSVEMNNF